MEGLGRDFERLLRILVIAVAALIGLVLGLVAALLMKS